MFDISARLPAAGEHQHRLHQHLAPVVQRCWFAGVRDRRRQRIAEPNRSARRAQGVQSDVGHDLVAAAFHHHRNRAVTLHLASALQVEIRTCQQRQNPLSGGHFRGWASLSPPLVVNDQGEPHPLLGIRYESRSEAGAEARRGSGAP